MAFKRSGVRSPSSPPNESSIAMRVFKLAWLFVFLAYLKKQCINIAYFLTGEKRLFLHANAKNYYKKTVSGFYIFERGGVVCRMMKAGYMRR